MARSATEATNGVSKRKGDVNGNGAAKGATATEAQIDDATYKDFFWTYTEEPHRTRRLAIIKAHPEVSEPKESIGFRDILYRAPEGEREREKGNKKGEKKKKEN